MRAEAGEGQKGEGWRRRLVNRMKQRGTPAPAAPLPTVSKAGASKPVPKVGPGAANALLRNVPRQGPSPVSRPTVAPTAGKAALVLLPGKQTKGRCLDGTQPGYYVRRGYGTGAKKWIILLEGGGWCFTSKQCITRANTDLGSSKAWPSGQLAGQEVVFSGLASPNRTVNPDFFNWNVVVLKYCDGASFSGAAGPTNVAGRVLYFMGHWNLQGALADLLLRQGLGAGSSALVGGCSAGGQAVSMVCDSVATWFKIYGVSTKCFMDAGFFPDIKDQSGAFSFRARVQGLVTMQNFDKMGFNAACRTFYAPLQATWKCFFPQYNLNFVRSPIFITNSIIDYKSIALTYATRTTPAGAAVFGCLSNLDSPRCSPLGKGLVKEYGNIVRAWMQYAVQKQQKARGDSSMQAFALDQPVHCVMGSDQWNTIRTPFNNLDLRTAFHNWYFSLP